VTHYRRVEWHHNFDDEPVTLLSEVGDFGVETRKIEIYRDGRADIADKFMSTGSTMLSERPLPSVEEIEDQPEFTPSLISRGEFEEAWERATTNRSVR
jgi:hypothetical protein